MSNLFRKYLGKLALMSAAVLWAGCSDAKEEKVDKPVAEKPQASQAEDFKDALKNINKNAKSKYLPSREMDTAGVTALYGCVNCGKSLIQVDSARLDNLVELVGCLYGTYGGGGIATKPKGDVIIPKDSDIEVIGVISITKPFILKVIRQRAAGLRHIFNKYRRKKQGFKQGTLVLKLKIGTLGIVSDVAVESTTTDYPEFDADIVKAVSRWKFPRTKYVGTVTFPLEFYERIPLPAYEIEYEME